MSGKDGREACSISADILSVGLKTFGVDATEIESIVALAKWKMLREL